MAKPKSGDVQYSGNHFRFNLLGLIIFSLCLVAGTAFTVGKFSNGHSKSYTFDYNTGVPDARDKTIATSDGPWGELLTQNINLERPGELISSEVLKPQTETWVFHGMNLSQVKSLFNANGLDAQEVEH